LFFLKALVRAKAGATLANEAQGPLDVAHQDQAQLVGVVARQSSAASANMTPATMMANSSETLFHSTCIRFIGAIRV